MAEAMVWRRETRESWPYFTLALALAVAGFWPTFFGALTQLGAPHHLHGWSATLWMSLPLLQSWLIRARRRHWHRRLGYASLGLASVVVASGLWVVQIMAARHRDAYDVLRGKFVYLDLTGIALFVGLLALAVRAARRRDHRLHVRLMGCTALIPLEAALERLYVNVLPALVPDLAAGLYASVMTLEFACLAFIAADLRSGQLRWPFPAMLAYYVAMHVTMTPVATNAHFIAFTAWIAAL